MSQRVLVIEDSAEYRELIAHFMRDILQLEVETCDNASDAIVLLSQSEQPFQIVTTDIDFGGQPHGIFILEYLLNFSRGETCIIISGTTVDVTHSIVIAEALNEGLLAHALLKTPRLPLELHRFVPQILREQSQRKVPVKLFISYRRDDTADVTGRIYDRLEAEFRREFIFRDIDSIPTGMDFRDHIRHHVLKCDALLAIIGKSWLAVTTADGKRRIDQEEDYVRIEISTALQRGIPVIPVLVQGAEMPKVADLPLSLQDLSFRHARHIRRDPDFHDDVSRLINDLRRMRESKT